MAKTIATSKGDRPTGRSYSLYFRPDGSRLWLRIGDCGLPMANAKRVWGWNLRIGGNTGVQTALRPVKPVPDARIYANLATWFGAVGVRPETRINGIVYPWIEGVRHG